MRGALSFKGELETKLISSQPKLTRRQRWHHWWHGKWLDWKISAGVEPRGRAPTDWRPRPTTYLGWLYCRLRGKL